MKYKFIAVAIFLLTLLTINVLADSEYEVTVDGKVVRLANVGSGGSIVINVDGVLETIPAKTTETINGIEITNEETYYNDLKSERSAKIGIPGGQDNYVVLKVYPGTSAERNEYLLRVGDEIGLKVANKIVRLVNVGSGGSIVVSVDGIQETIPALITETVNGVQITNIEIHYEDTKAERSARIRIEGEIGIVAIPEKVPEKESTTFTNYVKGTQLSVICAQSTRGGNLAKYPAPFLSSFFINEEFNKLKLVVGKNAPASDTLAAIDIATKLQDYAERQGAPIRVDINPVLDSEIIGDAKDYNLILIGQAANSVLNKYITSDTALIELVPNGDNWVLIVTGPTSLDIRHAAQVLANYEDFKLEGSKCKVNSKEIGQCVTKEECPVPECPGYKVNCINSKCTAECPTSVCVVNRICEPEYGENEANCPQDCKEISIPLQCDGCMKDGSCLDFGMRIVESNIPKYCDLNKQFIPQKSANAECQNNFECDSNICAASKCISEGFLKKVMSWFAKMFGYVVKG